MSEELKLNSTDAELYVMIDGKTYSSDQIKSMQSQLDAQSAYVEELKTALIDRVIGEICEKSNDPNPEQSAKGMLSHILDKSSITSLGQVKREAKIEALQDYDACLSSFPMTVEEYIANNLKEQPQCNTQ